LLILDIISFERHCLMGLVPPVDPFSEVASQYDSSFSDKPFVRSLRQRVQDEMLEHYPRNASILELGCGTGIDAVFLAEHGYQVVASDPAMGMLDMTSDRIRTSGQQVSVLQMRAEHLSGIRDASFEGILSNFGALNCVQNLETVLNASHRILRDNGVFILTLINRFSIVETLAYLRHGKTKEAFRRWHRSGVSVPVGTGNILTWYHSLSSIKKMIKGKFTIQKVLGLNILTPTPSFEDAYDRHPRLVRIAGRMERMVDTMPIVSTLGDHYVLVLERFE
jgi:ubiquinone/menaquinone biosynthesis C-methylase UbiE